MTTFDRATREGTKTILESRNAGVKVVAVANQKGGVGKTDLVVNISYNLASQGKRVLLIDMDPQANATDYLLSPETPIIKSTADLLLDESVSLDDVVIRKCRPNLDLVPADGNLSSCQIRLANDINMQFKLKKKLRSLVEGERRYDYVLIDTPPSLGILTVNTLTAATHVLIPVQTQYFAMDGVMQLLDTIQKIKEDLNQGIQILGAVLTMYDRRTLLAREVKEKVTDSFTAGRVFSTVIPINVRLAEAPSYHKSIVEYDAGCNGARAYDELTREILSCQGV